MMEAKFIVEIEIPDSKVQKMRAYSPAGFTILDNIKMKIEQALTPLILDGGKKVGDFLIYQPEEGVPKIELYQKCPKCGHPWALHFSQTKIEMVAMSDATQQPRQVIGDPTPTKCQECDCMEATK
jgi:hypothetical protein